MRFGTVALVGRSNVGKSTFLNTALGEELAIVSPRPQTTRDALLGVVHRADAQIAFIDTPGLHRPHSELGRRMNAAALDAARSTDVLVFMTDAGALAREQTKRKSPPPAEQLVQPGDREFIALLPAERPALLVVNKVDLLRDRAWVLPLMEAFQSAHEFAAVIPTSLREKGGAEAVLAELEKLLPEGEPGFSEDDLTNRPTSFFIREYVREQVMLGAEREVPHAVAVAIDRIDDSGRTLIIKATLHVEKSGQRGILIGKGGARIKQIGTAARERIEALVGRRVHLELFVRVTPRWKDMPRQLAELGYEAPELRKLSTEIPDAPRRKKR
jgi:GTP-binding protein Era